jgi:hypothetical protein
MAWFFLFPIYCSKTSAGLKLRDNNFTVFCTFHWLWTPYSTLGNPTPWWLFSMVDAFNQTVWKETRAGKCCRTHILKAFFATFYRTSLALNSLILNTNLIFASYSQHIHSESTLVCSGLLGCDVMLSWGDYQFFGGTCRLHIQGRSEDGSDTFLRSVGNQAHTRLHCVTTRKTTIHIYTTAPWKPQMPHN